MRLLHRKSLLLSTLMLAVLIVAVMWLHRAPDQPVYDGKQLSVWLDELCALGNSTQFDSNSPPAEAVRAIGTNAIPWLLSELKMGANPLGWRLNMLLEKQRLIKYRVRDPNKHWSCASLGFLALGRMGEPAIPDLMSLLESRPNYIPVALAAIGTPALSALQQCLTNTKSYSFSDGSTAPIIPGETIACIYNAMNAGRISKPEAAIFLPSIRDWAKSTNKYPATYATQFLTDFHLSVSADADRDELLRAWK